MKNDNDRSHQQSFDQGRLSALEIAFATFVRMQQEVPKDLFCQVIAQNAEVWKDTTLDMAVTDDYRNGAEFGFQQLLSQLSLKRQS